MKVALIAIAVLNIISLVPNEGAEYGSSLRRAQDSLDNFIPFVSNISTDEKWCLTATETKEHGNLGFRKCDTNSRPANQLWKLEGNGLLRSGVETSYGDACAVVGFGDTIFDGVRIRLGPCDPNSVYYKFSWNADDFYLKTEEKGYCITNRGPNPNDSDSILGHEKCIDRGDYQWNVGGRIENPTPAPTPPTVGCPATQESGGKGSFEFHIDMKQTSGTVDVEYEMYNVPDSLVITYEGTELFSTGGLVSGSSSFSLTYGSPTSTSTTVTASLEAPTPGTKWTLFVGCPK